MVAVGEGAYRQASWPGLLTIPDKGRAGLSLAWGLWSSTSLCSWGLWQLISGVGDFEVQDHTIAIASYHCT